MTLDRELLKKLGWSDELLDEVTRGQCELNRSEVEFPPIQDDAVQQESVSSTHFYADSNVPLTSSSSLSFGIREVF